ncbi:hypothetical protein BN1708_013785 [Verticillium longisporum]|uniref:Serine/threonine-protein phosphatase 4 regulatory subunit 3-like central domain-containing protein n=1 Tax=Verticillium longisporum TaxID=100787 RepID=A0A0G4LNV5_VERLO|nr:hypothetical protein BN1708_013785 [Verticillium longisporum]
MDMPSNVHMPTADLKNLSEIEQCMRVMNQTANGRDALAKFIMSDDYIGKLTPLVEMAEDLESLTDLHRLCNIMKTIILLNDTSIIEHAIQENHPLLTDSLVDLLLVEADLGVRSQIADALRVLLDQGPPVQAQEAFARANGEFPGKTRLPQATEANHELLLANFYEHSARKLFRPLMALEGRTDMNFTVQQASMFTYLIEVLGYFIRQHLHRSKFFVLQNDIAQRVAQLLSCPENPNLAPR